MFNPFLTRSLTRSLISRPSTLLPLPLRNNLSTSSILCNKASKSRSVKSKDKERLRGTGVGASTRVYGKEDTVLGKSGASGKKEQQNLFEEESEQTTPTVGGGEKEVQDLRGSGVGASRDLYPERGEVTGRDEVGHEPSEAKGTASTASSHPPTLTSSDPSFLDHHPHLSSSSSSFPDETIYTASTPFNVPLVLTVAFVFSVFALNGADMARVGYSTYNVEKEEYELAPKWKRYVLASGFLGVSIGVVSWGALMPARIVTRLERVGQGRVRVHTPITSLPGLSPREVEVGKMHLLGPLSEGPRTWHPRNYPRPSPPKKGLLSLFSLPSSKKTKDPWAGPPRSHVPLTIEGDRASYSLMRKRGKRGEMGDKDGAWCSDWEGLEKALLGVKGASV